MKEINQLVKKIRAGQYAMVYFLQGEEPYYIDLISDLIEKNALDEAAKGFNQIILYGKDVRMRDVLDNARRFPMMSDRQVVIVKEAQNIPDLGREAGDRELINYLKNPLPSTILVFCYKHKKLDGRKELAKTLTQHAEFITTKKLYDNQVPDWIREYFKARNLKITDKAVFMLADFIGNNLERLSNEINKMLINIKEKIEIDDHLIQKYIGISKDYNVFELQKALAYHEVVRVNKIAQYFEANPKKNPLPQVIAVLYGFFAKLLMLHAYGGLPDRELASKLKVNPYFLRDYRTAAKYYPPTKTRQVIRDLRYADLQFKGVYAANLPEGQILKELVFKILH